jgi:C4-dicarboxylate-specific signal transduction histidine kinase
VLDNLVANACFWTARNPDGDERRLGIILSAPDGRLVVADSGPGVHEEIAGHIFEPFTTMRADGKGLGLHISAELMKNLGGRLRLACDEDDHLIPAWATGASFVLEFDAATAGAADSGEPAQVAPDPG